MNSRQREVIQSQLKDEKAVIDALEKNYISALSDVKKTIKELQSMPATQSKAYQIDFQKQLERQIEARLDVLQGANFTTLAGYMNACYDSGFIGTMYSMHGQGVPLVLPINEKQRLNAIQKTSDDIKLANKLGVNTSKLKSEVVQEIQRGFSVEMPYVDIARNISARGQADMSRSLNIARTEGHRIQSQSKLDAITTAKENGADVVKQWDATLDDNTRDTHRQLDGQIREIDEDFEVEGMSAPFPGGFGDPAEDCNCRCCLLERARWALDSDELAVLQDRADYFGLDKADSFDEFREKYLNATTNDDTMTSRALPLNLQLFAMKPEDFETIRLPKDEYAHIMSEIATNLTEEQSQKKVFSKHIGDYIYTVENKGFGDYRVIDKVKIGD